MKVIEATVLTPEDKEMVRKLWNKEYPQQLQYANVKEFNEYLDGCNDQYHLLAIDSSGQLVGWTFLFTRENSRWFAIILDSNIQRQGVGSHFLQLLKTRETELNGWVIDHNNYVKADGTPYLSPLEFYMKNGFIPLPETRLETDKISVVKIIWLRLF